MALLSAWLLLATACSGSNPAGQELRAADARVPPNQELLTGIGLANNAFAVNLYRTASTEHGNFAYSPYTLLRVLAMARAGSSGTTRAQFDQVLGASAATDIDAGVNAADAKLTDRTGDKRSTERRGRITLEIATALWGQRGTRIKDDLLRTLATQYGTGFRVADFRSDAETARLAVNRWVSDTTQEHISELVPRGDITQYTRFLATAGAYMKAPWQLSFNAADTRSQSFDRLDDHPIDVRMMHMVAPEGLRWASLAAWTAVEIPYLGDELALDVIMPADGQFTAFEQGFTDEQLREIVASLQPQSLDLRLPRFQFTTSANLHDPLTAMGLGTAFSREADFSGVTNDDVLSLNDVIYQGFFGIDEEGSDSANTATASSEVLPPLVGTKTVTIDRPFIFVVRDRETGLILFMGRVVSPN